MSTEKPEAFSALLDRHSDVAPALSGSPQDIATYLLSPERAQRFELLMLLISNLGKVLVVSGPDGIGKSTFLGLLKQRAFESWRVVRVAGDGRLRHGDIINQIAEQLAMASVSEHALADYLEQLGRHKNLLVLLLDDAGKVAPGVLSALWQFARKYPAFRLVLALRPDEAHLKIATDEAVLSECHYIDIPALTAPKCKSYLKRLATRPPRLLSMEDITPARTRAVYRASHGVPGRIIQLLIDAPAARAKARRRRWVAVAAAGVVGMAAVLAYFQFRRPATELQETESPAQPKPKPFYRSPPAAPSPTPDAPTGQPLSLPPPQLPEPPALPMPATPPSIADERAVAPPSGADLPKAQRPSVVSQVAASAKQEALAAPPLPDAGTVSTPAEFADKRLMLEPEGYGPALGNATKSPLSDSTTPTADEALDQPLGDLDAEPASGAKPVAPVAEPTDSGLGAGKLPHAVEGGAAKTPLATGTAKPPPAAGTPPSPAPPHAPTTASPASAASGLAIAGLRDAGWLLAQSPQAYTLRVMAVREASSIKALLQRYPAMQGQVAAFASRHGAATSYPVYFGVFATEADAKRAAAKLPAALGKPFVRQMKQVQQEARTSAH